MSWRITDYNLNKMSAKTTDSINKEYNRLKNIVSRRISTFEKHNLQNLSQVRSVKANIQDNDTRRQKERAILEMKRFLNLDVSSYEGFKKSMKSTISFWSEFGIENLNMGNIENFLNFLEWVKSFMGSKYNASAVSEAWVHSNGSVESAREIFDSLQYDGL